jgi:hypothetical protein
MAGDPARGKASSRSFDRVSKRGFKRFCTIVATAENVTIRCPEMAVGSGDVPPSPTTVVPDGEAAGYATKYLLPNPRLVSDDP